MKPRKDGDQDRQSPFEYNHTLRTSDIARGLTLAYFLRNTVASCLLVIVPILDSVEVMTSPAFLLPPRDLNMLTNPHLYATGWVILLCAFDLDERNHGVGILCSV